jgi:gas vesicle protein
MEKVLIGVLGGLVAGVAIGLLVAPVSGTEARGNILSGARNGWKRIWGKRNYNEDPWAEYNERKAAATANAS